MTADYFLIEGPRAIPDEFAAWEKAHDDWIALAMQVLSGDKTAEADAELASRVAAALEARARAAFSHWCRT